MSLEQKGPHKSDASTRRGAVKPQVESAAAYSHFIIHTFALLSLGESTAFPKICIFTFLIHQEVIFEAPKKSKSHRDKSCPSAVLGLQKDVVRRYQMSTI